MSGNLDSQPDASCVLWNVFRTTRCLSHYSWCRILPGVSCLSLSYTNCCFTFPFRTPTCSVLTTNREVSHTNDTTRCPLLTELVWHLTYLSIVSEVSHQPCFRTVTVSTWRRFKYHVGWYTECGIHPPMLCRLCLASPASGDVSSVSSHLPACDIYLTSHDRSCTPYHTRHLT